MQFEQFLRATHLAAAFALEDDFRLEVSLAVGQQVGFLREPFVAQIADVGFFTCLRGVKIDLRDV